MSLRRRLLLATGLAVLVGLLVVDASTYIALTRSQVRQVDDALQLAHTPIEQLAEAGTPQALDAIPQIAPGLFVAILDSRGRVAYSTPGRIPGREIAEIDVSKVDLGTRFQTLRPSDGDDMRVRVDRTRSGSIVVVGQSLHEVNQTRRQLLAVLAVASVAATGLAIGLAWWLVRAGLRPLTRVEASAAAISDEALPSQRVPGADSGNEVGSLATALNAMLDRLDISRAEREETLQDLTVSEARMRQFVADASHELRTPIAATSAYAELFGRGARDNPADLERAMAGIHNETARMSELVDDLLLLAQLDDQRPLATEPVDLTEIVLESVDAARTMEPERVFRLGIDSVVEMVGDRARLRQVVDNLLANVRAHAPSSAVCNVHLTGADGTAVLIVADEGPGTTDEQIAQLFDRFYRADEARTRAKGGSGLGLSIVKAITEAYGGSISATHNDPVGLAVTVRLPTGSRPAG